MSSLPRRSCSQMGTVNLTKGCAGKFLLMLANLRTEGPKQAELSNKRYLVYWGYLGIIESKLETRSTVCIPPWFESHSRSKRNADRRLIAWQLPVFSAYVTRMLDFRSFYLQKTHFVVSNTVRTLFFGT